MSWITAIVPMRDLDDIAGGDLENDTSIMFDWLKLSPNQALVEPTPRVKAAIKSILKDENNQNHFISLLNNSINRLFEIKGYVAGAGFDLLVANCIETKRFYDKLFMYLNVTSAYCYTSYYKNINKQFKLVLDQHGAQMTAFFEANFDLLDLHAKIFTFLEEISFKVYKVLINLLVKNINEYVDSSFTGVWDRDCISQINERIHGYSYLNISVNDLVQISYNELISLRTTEIYALVVNYPQTKVALNELHVCLSFHKHQRNRLVAVFAGSVEDHLLNAGINTTNLIKIYIKIIKLFLIIDPKGVLLDKVIRPIRRYLKTRDDIINKLVAGLFGDEPELMELHHELQNTENNFKVLRNFDELNDLNWTPDPIDALSDFKKFKINDIIESLISIFDKKEIFIVEFTIKFGNKLINNEDSLSNILNIINVLKLRFGKNEFFNLDIMIKDFINSKSKKQSTLNFLILSHLYWNDIIDTHQSSFKLHPKLLREFDTFHASFKHENHNRFLKLLPGFGSIKLKVNGRQFEVGLDKASVLYLFYDEESVSPDRVGVVLEMSAYDAQKCLDFWAGEGVLEKVGGVYIEA